jgi:hypothetical protein
VLAATVWILPVVFNDEPVSRTAEITHGSTRITEETIGWGSLRSESVVVALLGSGVILLIVGMFPPGNLKRVRTAFGEVEFAGDALGDLAKTAAQKAPAAHVDEVFTAALTELGRLAGDHRRAPFAPTPQQISEAIDRAIKSDW